MKTPEPVYASGCEFSGQKWPKFSKNANASWNLKKCEYTLFKAHLQTVNKIFSFSTALFCSLLCMIWCKYVLLLCFLIICYCIKIIYLDRTIDSNLSCVLSCFFFIVSQGIIFVSIPTLWWDDFSVEHPFFFLFSSFSFPLFSFFSLPTSSI